MTRKFPQDFASDFEVELDASRLSRIKTVLMDPAGTLEPHDLAWLLRLADDAVKERQKARNHTEG